MTSVASRGARAILPMAALAFCALSAAPALAQACPDVGLSGEPLTYGAAELSGGGLAFDVIAGGDVDLGACGSVPGFGWIILGPDFELNLSGAAPGEVLTLSVTGSCDTVLLVNDATGAWYFDDDSAGDLNPAITLAGATDGIYDIWVGTFGIDTCPASLVVRSVN